MDSAMLGALNAAPAAGGTPWQTVWQTILAGVQQFEGNANLGYGCPAHCCDPATTDCAGVASQALAQYTAQYGLVGGLNYYNTGNPTTGYGAALAAWVERSLGLTPGTVAGIGPSAAPARGGTGTAVTGTCAGACAAAYPGLLNPGYLLCMANCGLGGNPAPGASSSAGQPAPSSFCTLPLIGAPICATLKNVELRLIVFILAILAGLIALYFLLAPAASVVVQQAEGATHLARRVTALAA